MAAKKKKVIEVWEIIVISLGLAIGLYVFVVKPYVLPLVQDRAVALKPAVAAKPQSVMQLQSLPRVTATLTTEQQALLEAKLKYIKVKNILDDANQIFGIAASAVGIIIGLKTLLRNMKAKKTA